MSTRSETRLELHEVMKNAVRVVAVNMNIRWFPTPAAADTFLDALSFRERILSVMENSGISGRIGGTLSEEKVEH